MVPKKVVLDLWEALLDLYHFGIYLVGLSNGIINHGGLLSLIVAIFESLEFHGEIYEKPKKLRVSPCNSVVDPSLITDKRCRLCLLHI